MFNALYRTHYYSGETSTLSLKNLDAFLKKTGNMWLIKTRNSATVYWTGHQLATFISTFSFLLFYSYVTCACDKNTWTNTW